MNMNTSVIHTVPLYLSNNAAGAIKIDLRPATVIDGLSFGRIGALIRPRKRASTTAMNVASTGLAGARI